MVSHPEVPMAEQRADTRVSGVVVRVDGTRVSNAAVAWAARAAVAHDELLTLCLVLPADRVDHLLDTPDLAAATQQHGEYLLARARAKAEAVAPGVRTTLHLASGQPAAEMLRLAENADLVVVGSLGPGWTDRLVIAATATQVAKHAPCTVVVTRLNRYRAKAPVLVGVDDSDGAQAALEFAFDTASRSGLEVHALHAYTVPPPLPGLPRKSDLARVSRVAGQECLDDALALWLEKYPHVPVRREVCRGPASRAVVNASLDASLAVVGSRGRGGFAQLLLGSVGHYLLWLASCPVAIARTPAKP
jgi:nucleotide-binding universal stress UspA family protein